MKHFKYIAVLIGFFITKESFSQTYVPNRNGVKLVSLEKCIKKVGGAPCDSCFMLTNKVGNFDRCLHISEIRAMIDSTYQQDSVILINNAAGTYSLKNEYNTYYEFGYKFEKSGDSIFLTDLDGTKTDTVIITGAGVSSNTLSMSGNIMTSNVDAVSDTSLIIGTVNGNLATNTITLNVNNVTDTVLVIGRATLNLSGNQITSNVNNVTDTTLVIGTVSNTSSTNSLSTTVNGVAGSSVNIINSNTNSLSGNTITGSVNGVSDTVLVIGENRITLSGNQLTSEVNNISDTSLIIGELDISSATNTMTIEVNNLTDNATIVNSNSLSYGTVSGILTSSINGISDTTTITVPSGLGGIYGGSGTVATGAVADMGYISSADYFGIGGFPSFPPFTRSFLVNSNRHYGLEIQTEGDGFGQSILFGGDSVSQAASYLMSRDYVELMSYASNFTTSSSLYLNGGYCTLQGTTGSGTSLIQIIGGDSIVMTTPQLNLKINGSYGTANNVLKSNGTNATWQSEDFPFERKYEYFNDMVAFVFADGTLYPGTSCSGGGMSTLDAYMGANDYGSAYQSTGSTASCYNQFVSNTNVFTFGYGVNKYVTRVGFSDLSTGTQRYVYLCGFIKSFNGLTDQEDGAYFLYDEGGVSTGSAASANWQCVTVDSFNTTFTTTGTAVTTAFQKLEIVSNAAGTSIEFKINGSTVATHTTDIPSSNTKRTGFGNTIIKTIGTTERRSVIDYIYVKADLTNTR